MTPKAPERTTLEEDLRSDARSIVHGEALYVKYPPDYLIIHVCCDLLRRRVFGSGDNVILQLLVQLDEEGAVSGDAYHEVPELVRVFLRGP